MKRPSITGGLNHKRLDDPTVVETKSDKLVEPGVFKIIGELYQQVPKAHKYRFYVLILTLLCCTGRRFSEIALLPHQELTFDDEGKAFLRYFPRKTSKGDTFTPQRKLYLSTETISIVQEVLAELAELTAEPRATAHEMHKIKGPDLRFLQDLPLHQRLYNADLQQLGISPTTLASTGFLRKRNYAWPDFEAVNKQGIKPRNPIYFTTKEGIEQYCLHNFTSTVLSPIHIDQQGTEYFLKDLLLVRHQGLSSGTYASWLATSCTHSMFTTFLRYFPKLAEEYASSSLEVDFTSHHFRHTLNTLMDEGGLSDLLQT